MGFECMCEPCVSILQIVHVFVHTSQRCFLLGAVKKKSLKNTALEKVDLHQFDLRDILVSFV